MSFFSKSERAWGFSIHATVFVVIIFTVASGGKIVVPLCIHGALKKRLGAVRTPRLLKQPSQLTWVGRLRILL